MADDKKKTKSSKKSDNPAKPPTEPFMNLELPASSEVADSEEVLEVIEVEEEAIPTVEAGLPPAEEAGEVIEVLEEGGLGGELTEADVMELLDFVDAEEPEPAQTPVKSPQPTPTQPIRSSAPTPPEHAHGGGPTGPKDLSETPAHRHLPTQPRHVLESLDEVLDAEAASDPRMERAPVDDPKAKARFVPETMADVDLACDPLEIIDVSGGLPSSTKSGKLIEDDEPEVSGTKPSQAGEEDVVVDYEEMLGESESAVDVGKPVAGKSDRHSGVDIIAEALESGVDLHREHAHPPKAPHQPAISDSDINFESILEDRNESASSVDLGASDERPSLAPHSDKLKTRKSDSGKEGRTELVTDEDAAAGAEVVGEDLLIDRQPTELEIVDDDEYLVEPKQKATASDDEVIEGLDQPLTDEHSAFEEPVVEAFAEATEEPTDVSEPAAVFEAADVVEPAEAADVAEAPPAKAQKPRKEEQTLVGAGAGKRRGGFMPFLFGGVLAAVIVAGAGAAAWYLDVLPPSPSAPKKLASTVSIAPPPAAPKGPVASEAQQARDLIDEGKYIEAIDLVKDAKAGPELAMLGLANLKKLDAEKKTAKLSDPEVVSALKQIEEGGAKNVAADIRARLKATDDLAAFVSGSGKVGERVQELEAEKLKLQSQMTAATQEQTKTQSQLDAIRTALTAAKLPTQADQLKVALSGAMGDANAKVAELTAAEAKLAEFKDALAKAGVKADGTKGIADLAASRDALAKDVQTLDSALDAGLKELKDGNLLGNDPDKTKQLVEGIKKARSSSQSPLSSSIGALVGPLTAMTKTSPGLFQKVFDTAKLSTELAAAKANNVFAETPEQRVNTILLLLNDRGFKDAKELDNAKRLIEWVRSKDSKATPETKAKALLASALIERNLENYAAARQGLEAAVKEAEALKTGDAVQKLIARDLQEVSDPALYYLPEADRRLADGDIKGAIAALNAGLKVMPDSPQLHLKRGQVAFEAGRYAGSLSEAASKAIRDDAEAARKNAALAAESYYLVGLVDENAGQWAKAEANYRQAVQLGGPGIQSEKYRSALARLLQRGFGGASESTPPPASEEEAVDETATTFVAFIAETEAEGDQGDEAVARKRLEESITLAKDLIQSANPKTQGEGYMLLGAAQARLGKSNEGLKNFVKGLKLLYPDWPAKELDKMVTEHPAFSQPDVAVQANPLLADQYFNKGLSLFWANKYGDAEKEFAQAVSFVGQDPRYRYFLGLSRYVQGTKEKQRLAGYDFEQGARLEASSASGTAAVNASLERVQGDLRRVLDGYREGAGK